MTENEVSYAVRGAIFNVYNTLGPGLLESVYEAAMCYELRKAGLKVEQQKPVKVVYKGQLLPVDYRLDLLVEDCVVVELKSVEKLTSLHYKQLLSYLRLTGKRIGILVNFNTNDIMNSIKRKIMG